MSKETKQKHAITDHLQTCPARGIIGVISKKWVFLVINALGNNQKLRFNGLMTQLEGVSPKTLADTLKTLEKEGLIDKKSFNEIPPRVEYSLTGDGRELRKAIMPLLQWAASRNNSTKTECKLRCQQKTTR